ncbi:unnamed protein product [Brassica oleracea]
MLTGLFRVDLVKDLEGELETTRQRSKENLEQAIMTERERFTQMQWDMHELRQRSYEMEMKLKSSEKLLEHERKLLENTVSARKKLLSDCRILHDQLKEYNLNLSNGNGNLVKDSTTVSDALRLLSISDDQIEEAQLLAGFDEAALDIDKSVSIYTETRIMEDELRKILADIFVENAKLRKQVNSAMLRALQKDVKTTEDVNEENGDEKEEASTETLNI